MYLNKGMASVPASKIIVSQIAIRMNVVNLSVIGRATQGVRLINLGKRNDEIASVCKVLTDAEEQAAQEKAEKDAAQKSIENQATFEIADEDKDIQE